MSRNPYKFYPPIVKFKRELVEAVKKRKDLYDQWMAIKKKPIRL